MNNPLTHLNQQHTVYEWIDFFIDQEHAFDQACVEWQRLPDNLKEKGSALTKDDLSRQCNHFIIPLEQDMIKKIILKFSLDEYYCFSPAKFVFRNDPQFKLLEGDFPLNSGTEILGKSIQVKESATILECLYLAALSSRWPSLKILGGPAVNFSLNSIPSEKLGFFMNLILSGRRPSRGLQLLDRWSILSLLIPELTSGRDLSQNRFHAYDIYEHLLRSCDAVESANLKVRWAALLHDVGKVPTRKEKHNGEASFHNHEMHSARMTVEIMKRFGLNRDFGLPIKFLVRNHMFHYTDEWTDKAIRRFIRRVNHDQLKDLIQLRLADRKGSGKKTSFPKALQKLINHIDEVETKENSFKVSDMKINGNDLIRLGMTPGPHMGDLLKEIHQSIINMDLENDLDILSSFAKKKIKEFS
jgi:putative nucleotidyltransferase with HDIG domain